MFLFYVCEIYKRIEQILCTRRSTVIFVGLKLTVVAQFNAYSTVKSILYTIEIWKYRKRSAKIVISCKLV